MENERTIEFIDDYRTYECLWNVKHKTYTNKTKRNDAYTALAQKYGTTEKGVRNKIKSLRSYFSREHQKVGLSKSGSATDERYESTWFAYRHLLFVADAVTPRKTKDSTTVIAPDPSLDQGNTPQQFAGNEINNEEAAGSNLSTDSTNNVVPQTANGPAGTSSDREPVLIHSSTSQHKEQPQPAKKTAKRKKEEDDQAEAEALLFLKKATTVMTEKDDCAIFGQLVASELRKLGPSNKTLAKQQIQNLIFDMQIKEIQVQATHTISLTPLSETHQRPATINEDEMSPSLLGPATVIIADSSETDNDSTQINVEDFLVHYNRPNM